MTDLDKETINFEYDLQGHNGPATWDINVRFWESAVYQNEVKNLDFDIGDKVYMTFEWINGTTSGLTYAIKECAIKDKSSNQEHTIVKDVS